MQLHLNSIHAVVQFRPSLKHPRAGGSKRKNNVAGDAEVSVELEESAEEKSVGSSKKQVYIFIQCSDLVQKNIFAWIWCSYSF